VHNISLLQIQVIAPLRELSIALQSHAFLNGTEHVTDNSTECGAFVAIDANNTFLLTVADGLPSHYAVKYNDLSLNVTRSDQNTTVTVPPFDVSRCLYNNSVRLGLLGLTLGVSLRRLI